MFLTILLGIETIRNPPSWHAPHDLKRGDIGDDHGASGHDCPRPNGYSAKYYGTCADPYIDPDVDYVVRALLTIAYPG